MTMIEPAAAAVPAMADAPAAMPAGPRAPLLRLLVCGSVDDGKSTLIGRLLWDLKTIKDDQAEALVRDSRRAGAAAGAPDFALLLDGLQAEREQGITIDVAYRYFATARRSFIVADTPGHEQYTRNMATGASTADLAVLLVDAGAGLRDQTRRHATIAALMGIRRFVLAVNKIDRVGYDRRAFDAIAGEFRRFALGLGVTDIAAIPVSALHGENLVLPAHRSMPWYRGPTVIEVLEAAPAAAGRGVRFRFPVQRVSRPGDGIRGYQGTVAGGSVKPGDAVLVLPSGRSAVVERIVTSDLERNAAVAGDAVTLVLDRQLDIGRGDMLVAPDAPPITGRAFTAALVALDDEGIAGGRRLWLKSASRRQAVTVTPGEALDLSSGLYHAADRLAVNDIGRVRLAFDEPAMFDPYADNRVTGAFVLIDPETLATVAGGTVIEADRAIAAVARLPSRVVMSLPADLADTVLAMPAVAARRDEIVIAPGSGNGGPAAPAA